MLSFNGRRWCFFSFRGGVKGVLFDLCMDGGGVDGERYDECGNEFGLVLLGLIGCDFFLWIVLMWNRYSIVVIRIMIFIIIEIVIVIFFLVEWLGFLLFFDLWVLMEILLVVRDGFIIDEIVELDKIFLVILGIMVFCVSVLIDWDDGVVVGDVFFSCWYWGLWLCIVFWEYV